MQLLLFIFIHNFIKLRELHLLYGTYLGSNETF